MVTTNICNCLQLLLKLDLTNLQIAYNHEISFGWNTFCLFLTKFLEGIKISQNSYLENSLLKFAGLCACKILI